MMSKKKKISQESNSSFGLILLFLSLCMDGVCGMQQDVVVPRFKSSALRLQQMLNVYGIGVSFVTAVLTGELVPGLRFLLQYKQCLWVCEWRGSDGVVRCPVWAVLLHRTDVYPVHGSPLPAPRPVNDYDYSQVF